MIQKIKRNILEIRQGGKQVLIYKLRYKYEACLNFILAPLAIILAFFFKLISNKTPVRIQRVDVGRIGHVYEAFSYMARKVTANDISPTIDIFYFTSSTGIIANKQLKKMLKRKLPIYPFGYLIGLSKKWGMKFFGVNTFSLELPVKKVLHKFVLEPRFQSKGSLLEFTTKEIDFCEEELVRLGIPKGAPFICFHLRDSAYLNAIVSNHKWDYHDYRDASLSNYVDAMKRFTQETGIYAIRMGAVTKEKITEPIECIIDYANGPYRSDILDLYLSYRCKFFVASDSGLSIIPEMMAKPIIFFNVAPVAGMNPWGRYVIYLPKKFFWKTENRYLTYHEVIHRFEVGIYASSEKFKEHNIKVEENSSDEIYDGLIELNQTLSQTFKRTEEDLRLQKRFWEIRGRLPRSEETIFIGSSFLRQNQDLLK